MFFLAMRFMQLLTAVRTEQSIRVALTAEFNNVVYVIQLTISFRKLSSKRARLVAWKWLP